MWFIRYRVKLSSDGSEDFREESGLVYAENLGDAAAMIEKEHRNELFSLVSLDYVTDGPIIINLPDSIIDENEALHV